MGLDCNQFFNLITSVVSLLKVHKYFYQRDVKKEFKNEREYSKVNGFNLQD